jgi:hypothetical protein
LFTKFRKVKISFQIETKWYKILSNLNAFFRNLVPSYQNDPLVSEKINISKPRALKERRHQWRAFIPTDGDWDIVVHFVEENREYLFVAVVLNTHSWFGPHFVDTTTIWEEISNEFDDDVFIVLFVSTVHNSWLLHV